MDLWEKLENELNNMVRCPLTFFIYSMGKKINKEGWKKYTHKSKREMESNSRYHSTDFQPHTKINHFWYHFLTCYQIEP